MSAFEKASPAKKSAAPAAPKYGVVQSAETIDALFPPLVTLETRGGAWLYLEEKKELKRVNLRLGITDGTNTELVERRAAAGPGTGHRRAAG